MKTCKRCSMDKLLSDFHLSPSSIDGLQHVCKDCHKEATLTKKNKNNPPSREQINKEQENYRVLREYGISLADYEEMEKSQDFKCAICGRPRSNIRLNIDHCHSTGKVRGLLCPFCNQGLGYFKDNIDSLLKAAEYLKKSKEDS